MSEIVTKIDLTNPDGVLLNTARRYCRHPILVLPRLHPLEVNENGIYPVPHGYAGHGQIKVDVTPKKETALIVTENGTYTPPEGTVYTSVTVRVTAGTAGDHTCSFAATLIPATCETGGCRRYTCTVCGKTYDTDLTPPTGHTYVNGVCTVCGKADPDYLPEGESFDILLTVGQTFSLNYEGSSPTVECPACLRVTDDGGILIFTALTAGAGTVYLRRGDTLIAAYRVRVTAAETEGGGTHVHSFIPATVPPTCTADGYTEHTCSDCGYSYRDTPVAALGHKWAACEHEGFSSGYGYVCSRCGALGEELESPECDHMWEDPQTVQPTCTKGGYTTYTCSVCGTVEKMEHTDPLGHAWEAQEHEGFSSGYGYVCSRCGALGDELDKPACTHPEESVAVVSSVSATCESAGSITYRCSICGLTWTDTVEALGHSWLAREHSGFSSGYGYVCSVCGALGEELSMPECDHMWENPQTTAPTCTEGGYTTYTCSICGTVKNMEFTEPLGHSYRSSVTAPTCLAGGYTTHTCSRCGHSYRDTPTAAAGHAWSGWTTALAPTCTEDGTEQRTCSVCGKTQTSTLEALGHADTSYHEGRAATCTAAGYTGYNVCNICGEVIDGKHIIPALGHDLSTTPAKAATCTEYGRTALTTCSRCDYSSGGEEIEPNGHNWGVGGGWVTVTEATCTAAGEEKHTCNTCGETETRTIAPLGHTYSASVTAPTCTAGGYTTYTCGRCGHSYTSGKTAALGHSKGEPELVRAATCTVPPLYVVRCTRCGAELERYEDDGAMLEHISNDGRITVEPTCTASGTREYRCTVCGALIRTESVPATGHKWEYWEDSSASSGYSRTCEICGETESDVTP